MLLWLEALGVGAHRAARPALAQLLTALLMGQSLRPSVCGSAPAAGRQGGRPETGERAAEAGRPPGEPEHAIMAR